jgi:hypothetical protein
MNFNLESNADSLSAPEYILQNFEASDRIAVLVRSRRAGETIQRDYNGENAATQDFQAWLRPLYFRLSGEQKGAKLR